MDVGVYTPYLDTFGGGERYILTIAECLARGHSVSILLDEKLPQWSGEQWAQKIQDRLNIGLDCVKFEDHISRKLLQQTALDQFSE